MGRNKKTLKDIFKKAAAVKKRHEKHDPAWGARKHDVFSATVIRVEEDAGTKNMTLMLDAGERIEDLQPGGGIGLPGGADQTSISAIVGMLKIKNEKEKQLAAALLQPNAPYPGILLTPPSEKLLQLLDKKLTERPCAELADAHQNLKNILADGEKIAELQAAYDVADLLKIFPKLVTAEELLAAQGPAHGNKTFSLIDYGEMTADDGAQRQYLKISVLPEAGLHVQKLFGEGSKKVLHFGETSHYLAGLKPGDRLHINKTAKNKDDFYLPRDLSGGTVMIAQGNGAANFISMLKEIRQRKNAGEVVGAVNLVLAARDEDSVWGLKELKPYLDDGTVARLDIVLADTGVEKGIEENPQEPFPQKTKAALYVHHGTRLADDSQDIRSAATGLFDPAIEKTVYAALKNGGGVFISGGEGFRNTIKSAVCAIAARQGKMLSGLKGKIYTTKSTMRIQGEDRGWSRRLAGKFLNEHLKKAGR
ncbi:MAG: hypothetical protein EA357_03950 [Micavibrio sp.]|nr:MAG: hypothetical protein EA357_03950 [Micavibrio sp.]